VASIAVVNLPTSSVVIVGSIISIIKKYVTIGASHGLPMFTQERPQIYNLIQFQRRGERRGRGRGKVGKERK
jgi:hypothetical protein